MATTIRTVKTYPLNGSTREFDIPFEYLARKFVTVTLIGTDRKVLTLTTDYRFATKTRIQTTKAWGPADGYDMIEIRRFTSATERLVDFTDGSILRAYDMNISLVQTLHVAEEARDLTADTIGVNNDGNLDARGRRIVNLADAVDPGDAVTLRQNQQWAGSALNSANAAKVSENNAKASENRSVQAETRSVQAETRSVTAETNSKNSETMAQKWAANPLGEIVANNMFSSFHYANQANLSAGAAKTSENNSASSASASAASAVTSKNEADRAKTEADKLGNMNDFAGTIKSVNTGTNGVAWKGDGSFDGKLWSKKGIEVEGGAAVFRNNNATWTEITGWYQPTGNTGWQTNGLRLSNRNNQLIDIYNYESVGSYQALVFHVFQAGNSNTSEAYYDFRNTGEFVGGSASFYKGNIKVQWGGRGHSYQENGDITNAVNGDSVFRAIDGNNTLSGSLNWLKNAAVHEVYLGGQEWWGSFQNNARTDWALGGGSVCTGVTQDMTAGRNNAWIDGIFHRKVWVRYGSGGRYIINSI
ncbi:putative tail fiber protein [Erwinia phage pEp_SNUABM_04]|nr:putative tail fiber protein [Erwinia phage pEp_SNUABM_04]